MKKYTLISANCLKVAIAGFLFLVTGLAANTYASADSALFRLSALQDTVDAGDTVELDIFIGGPDDPVNIVKEFEIEIESDSELIDKSKIEFIFDDASLNAYFGAAFTSSSSVDGMGRLNIKSACGSSGTTTARIGRVRFIVQDNVAGRQLLKFNFIKVSAKRLSGGGGGNPYQTRTDSVWIVRGFNQIPTSVKINNSNTIRIYPNPATDFVTVEGEQITRYELININGERILSDSNLMPGILKLDLGGVEAGMYMLLLQTGDKWNNYKVIKQ